MGWNITAIGINISSDVSITNKAYNVANTKLQWGQIPSESIVGSFKILTLTQRNNWNVRENMIPPLWFWRHIIYTIEKKNTAFAMQIVGLYLVSLY